MSKRVRKIALLPLGILVACVGAHSAPPQSQDVPVITAIEDFEEAIAPNLQIRSDGHGGYVNSGNVQSVIQAGGDWVLATNLRSSTRTVYLDFSQPVPNTGPGNGPPIALTSGLYHLRFITKCHLYGRDLLDLSPGQTTDCPMAISFEIGSDSYMIQMNPITGAYVYGETNWVDATCTGSSPGFQCSQWKLEPNGEFTASDGSVKKRNTARLVKLVTSKGKTTDINQGDFYFSFSIRMIRQ